jgi:phosphoribosylformylglycinamidine synthase
VGALSGLVPAIDLALEASLQKLLLELARARLVESAHDVADGGLVAALAECCTVGTVDVGARVAIEAGSTGSGPPAGVDAWAALFGEGASRVVVSVRAEAVEAVLARAAARGVPAARIGETGGESLVVTASPLAPVSLSVAAIRSRREGCLRSIVGE